jgi:hypothetical protein
MCMFGTILAGQIVVIAETFADEINVAEKNI